MEVTPDNKVVLSEKHTKWVNSRYAGWVLALISFAESVFAPILIDPFLAALVLASPKRWKYYVTISVIASVLGGVVAYFLGALFFDAIGSWLLESSGLGKKFIEVSEGLNKNSFVFVLIGAFTPIPYKLVALSSGLLHINFGVFLIASVIGRVARLTLAGYVTYVFGPFALSLFRKRFNVIVGIGLLIALVYLIVAYV